MYLGLVWALSLLYNPAAPLSLRPSTPAAVNTRLPATPIIKPQVLRRFPHDPEAFTQGLLFQGDRLLETTGQYGESTLRRVHPETGAVERQHALDKAYFGEGVAQVDQRLIWLTWRENIAFILDATTFAVTDQWSYEGEGWGLCYDGSVLWMSNGSSTLSARDPQTFAVLRTIDVSDHEGSVTQLNELECVGKYILANIWMDHKIAQIDASSGIVSQYIDAAGLLTAEQAQNADVLNGIAYAPMSQTLWLTGKHWPAMFEVKVQGLVENDDTTDGSGDTSTSTTTSSGDPSQDPPNGDHKPGGCATIRPLAGAPAVVPVILALVANAWRRRRPLKHHVQARC